MPKSLSEGWEVEYCYDLPKDSEGYSDIDAAKYASLDFKTKDEAMQHAKIVLPLDQFGSVRVTQFHSEQYEPGVRAYFREYDGDSIHVEQ